LLVKSSLPTNLHSQPLYSVLLGDSGTKTEKERENLYFYCVFRYFTLRQMPYHHQLLNLEFMVIVCTKTKNFTSPTLGTFLIEDLFCSCSKTDLDNIITTLPSIFHETRYFSLN